MELVTLNNGLKMPMEGFGVYQVTNPLECEAAVYNAILVGYRLIDTASVYRNEEAVGYAIKFVRSGNMLRERYMTMQRMLSMYELYGIE